MTGPDETSEDMRRGSVEAGALAAASEQHEPGADPIGPLNAVSEDVGPGDDEDPAE